MQSQTDRALKTIVCLRRYLGSTLFNWVLRGSPDILSNRTGSDFRWDSTYTLSYDQNQLNTMMWVVKYYYHTANSDPMKVNIN